MSASSAPPSDPAGSGRAPSSKRIESLKFFVLAFVLLPVLSVAVVGAYGFSVWFLQMIYGPPGL
ncbi:periplasmic nitrate reductase, NapE protein [Novispirillum itersonii]|uniref:periplasmic nitrate reductase, NapE protein n=1 Tax=Novispirillum itersonii TaxID=189 RepID=UPI000380D59A|nr:periplasmic nitrate reductase, NapE protein [Novispirillum itersonii]